MTPDERKIYGDSGGPEESDEPKFRERRSAFSEDDDESGEEPVIHTPLGVERPDESARPAGGETPTVEPPGGAPAGEASSGEAPSGEMDLERLDAMEIPEASFLEILQPLEVQALQFLGVVPITEDGQKKVLPRWAKHVIDLLGILEERTRGNLPDDEKRYLNEVLTQLRTRYLQVTK